MNMIASSGQLRAGTIRWALFLVPGIVLLGALSGQFAGSGEGNMWFDALTKPAVYPPPVLFGVVWTILYALMGLALAMVISAAGARGRKAAIIAFVIQLLINLAWSPVFFALHEMTWALILIGVLDVAVVVTIALFWRVRKMAALLLVPYLIWIAFATYLNFAFLEANRAADGQRASGEVQRIEF